MRSDLPIGHVALLLTDIEGSTRLLHRLGAEGYGRAQAEHRDLLRAAFRDHGGVEVDTQGDAFFYVFPTAASGLEGAVAGTRALARHPWSHGDSVRVRMGVHCGEPQRTDEGYVGMAVNTAARVSAIGHGGQILVSEAAVGEIDDAAARAGVTLRDLGAHRLKDLDAPQRLFQVVIPELPADFPPLRSAEMRPNNLPNSMTPFIGRTELLAEVSNMILDPRGRAVTLLGPGGTGKSRLAVQAGREVLHSIDDGVFFVGLASVRDAALVLPTVAGVLGVKEEPGRRLEDTLADHLAPKQILLVLDNFEQVEAAARDVAGLLAACPGLKVLATSRHPLRVKGERRVPVPPMALPGPDEPLPALEVVAQYEAVRLFAETATESCWDFDLTEDNVADVVEICRRVDALPLAIELATAKLATMSVPELLEALQDRLEVLDEGAVDLLDHQQTLRDLIAWSYDLLTEPEQRLWSRLAVFSGGASLAAVQAICDPGGEYRFPRDVDNLVMKSLVNLEFEAGGSGAGRDKRAVLLETLRDYALERLLHSDQADGFRQRHAAWYVADAEKAAVSLRSSAASRWLSRLDRDQGNFRAAMEYGFHGHGSAEDAARIAGALWFYWYERGMFQEGRQWLALAVAGTASPAAKARALLGLANLERTQGQHEAARDHCRQALDAFRSDGDDQGVADAQSQLGAVLQHLNDTEGAEATLADAASRLRLLVDASSDGASDVTSARSYVRGRLAFTLVLLGALKQLRGDLAGAENDYTESLALARDLGDHNYIATALVNLGEVKQLRGDGTASASLFRESLSLYHELGVRHAVAYCLEMLAGLSIGTASPGLSIGTASFERAAILLGAADRLREILTAPVESFNRERYDGDLQRAREGAGNAVFDAAWERGRAMPLAGAVAFALSAVEAEPDLSGSAGATERASLA